MRSKQIFKTLAGGIAAKISFDWLKNRAKLNLLAPFYHLVSDEPPPHVRHLYAVKSARQFSSDLDFLLKHFRPIDFFEFQKLKISGEEKPKNKPAFLLSFDDGLREFHDVAAPILLKKGVPAICFLNSQFIDNQALFYRYKASLLLDFFAGKDLPTFHKLTNLGQPTPAKLLSVNYQNRHLLDELADKIGLGFTQFLREQKPYLTTEQIQNLQKQGFQFGSHSIDHPEYRFLDFEEQIRQTAVSTDEICRRFSLNYRVFSFPFTDFQVPAAFFEKCRADGILDFSFGCAGIKNDPQPTHFQRVALEDGERSARETLHSEFFYFLCKMPFGKNSVLRG